jgi:hypothetical protein
VTVLVPKPKPMTDKEWALLRVLQSLPRSPDDLVTEGHLPRDSSLPGIHQTAASLVRKGWAQRHRDGGYHPLVRYTITAAGREALNARARRGARDAAAFVRARAGTRPHTRVMPDPAKGEYVNSDTGVIRVCRACVPGARTARHTCGLSGLQAMFPLGGAR